MAAAAGENVSHGGVRLRFVGRPGRCCSTRSVTGISPVTSAQTCSDAKTRLLVSVHTDLRLFNQIVGGESDDEEDFGGFEEREIQKLVTVSCDLQASIKSLEEAVKNYGKEVPCVNPAADPMLSPIRLRVKQPLQKLGSSPKMQYELIKRTNVDEKLSGSSPVPAETETVDAENKSMKGTIKVQLRFGRSNQSHGTPTLTESFINRRGRKPRDLHTIPSIVKTVASKVSEGIAKKLKKRSLVVKNCITGLRGKIKYSWPILSDQQHTADPIQDTNVPNANVSAGHARRKRRRYGPQYVLLSPQELAMRTPPALDAPLIIDGKRSRRPQQLLIEKWSDDYAAQQKREIFRRPNEESNVDADEASSIVPSLDSYASPKKLVIDLDHSTQTGKGILARQKIEDAKQFMFSHTDAGESGPSQKDQSKKKACCVCGSTLLVGHHYLCPELICRACGRFYHQMKQIIGARRNTLTCSNGGKCLSSVRRPSEGWQTFCKACRYAKCASFYPKPKAIANKTSPALSASSNSSDNLSQRQKSGGSHALDSVHTKKGESRELESEPDRIAVLAEQNQELTVDESKISSSPVVMKKRPKFALKLAMRYSGRTSSNVVQPVVTSVKPAVLHKNEHFPALSNKVNVVVSENNDSAKPTVTTREKIALNRWLKPSEIEMAENKLLQLCTSHDHELFDSECKMLSTEFENASCKSQVPNVEPIITVSVGNNSGESENVIEQVNVISCIDTTVLAATNTSPPTQPILLNTPVAAPLAQVTESALATPSTTPLTTPLATASDSTETPLAEPSTSLLSVPEPSPSPLSVPCTTPVTVAPDTPLASSRMLMRSPRLSLKKLTSPPPLVRTSVAAPLKEKEAKAFSPPKKVTMEAPVRRERSERCAARAGNLSSKVLSVMVDILEDELKVPATPLSPSATPADSTQRRSLRRSCNSTPITTEPSKTSEKETKHTPESRSDKKESAVKVTSPKDQEVIDQDEVDDSPVADRGPRIKHVCRRAPGGSQGERATFPLGDESLLRLSALPSRERIQGEGSSELLQGENKKPIEGAVNRGSQKKGEKKYMRKRRCQRCPGCLTPDCGKCLHCKDMIKFGGCGKIKQSCRSRICEAPTLDRPEVAKTIPFAKKIISKFLEDDFDCGDEEMAELERLKQVVPSSGTTSMSLRIKTSNPFTSYLMKQRIKSKAIVARAAASGGVAQTRISSRLAFAQKNHIARAPSAAGEMDARRNKDKSGRISPNISNTSVKVNANKPRLAPSLPSLTAGSSSAGLQQPTPILIKTDYKADRSVEGAWQHGMALIMSGTPCVRAVCRLCASLGVEELIYCSVCCSGFHAYCLDEKLLPKPDKLDIWCCKQCQYCHVCFGQNGLLQCDSCQETFHPECLGPNYPSKPTPRTNIWVCCKCLRCKSCGSANLGADCTLWLNDCSLCNACSILTDKGNYCPVCRKCYVDDDWDSKMIQCSTCHRWVHSKCEELTDEMYQVVSEMPEDVPFNCRICSPVRPSPWETMIRQEIQNGMRSVLEIVLGASQLYTLDPIAESPARDSVPSRRAIFPHSDIHEDVQKVDTACDDAVVVPNIIGKTDEIDKNVTGKDPNIFDASEKISSSLCDVKDEAAVADCIGTDHLVATWNDDSDGDNPATCTSMASDVGSVNQASDDQTAVVRDMLTENTANINSSSSDTQCSDTAAESAVCNEVGVNIVSGVVTSVEANVAPTVEYPAVLAEVAPLITSGAVEACGDILEKSSEDSSFASALSSLDSSHTQSSNDAEPDTNCVTMTEPPLRADSVNTVSVASDLLPNCLPSTEDRQAISVNSDSSVNENVGTLSLTNGLLENDTSVAVELNSSCLKPLADAPQVLSSGDQPLVAVSNSDAVVDLLEVAKLVASSNTTTESTEPNKFSPGRASTVASPCSLLSPSVCVTRLSKLVQCKPVNNTLEVTTPRKKKFPRDLSAIQRKLEVDGGYKTVEEFVYDVARILQYNIDLNSAHSGSSRNTSDEKQRLRTIFVERVEKIFPWFNVQKAWIWSSTAYVVPDGVLDDAFIPPSRDHTYAQWLEKKLMAQPNHISMFRAVQPPPSTGIFDMHSRPSSVLLPPVVSGTTVDNVSDGRLCVFCWKAADSDDDEAGRLIYAGQDDWVHVNCALWSAEVYEERDGAMMMVHSAMTRGRKLRCDACGKLGATVGCCQVGCNANFHFVCARRRDCVFLKQSKKIFCQFHHSSAVGQTMEDGSFALDRRVFVDTEGNRWGKRPWLNGLDPTTINVLTGSLTIEVLGRLTVLSDYRSALLPVDFRASRVYWSTSDARRRCVYTCRIMEVIPRPKVEVTRDVTVAHDEMDPSYDAELAAQYTFQATTTADETLSEADTASATESQDLDVDGELSDSDSCQIVMEKELTKNVSRKANDTENRDDHCYAASHAGSGEHGVPVAATSRRWNKPTATRMPMRGFSHTTSDKSSCASMSPAIFDLSKAEPSRCASLAMQGFAHTALEKSACASVSPVIFDQSKAELPRCASLSGSSGSMSGSLCGTQLSSSYPGASKSLDITTKKLDASGDVARPINDLSGLSSTTLRLLGLNRNDDLNLCGVSAPTLSTEQDDELTLVSIVNRLNEAAAKNKRSAAALQQDSGTPNVSGSGDGPGGFDGGSNAIVLQDCSGDSASNNAACVFKRITQTDGPMSDSDTESLDGLVLEDDTDIEEQVPVKMPVKKLDSNNDLVEADSDLSDADTRSAADAGVCEIDGLSVPSRMHTASASNDLGRGKSTSGSKSSRSVGKVVKSGKQPSFADVAVKLPTVVLSDVIKSDLIQNYGEKRLNATGEPEVQDACASVNAVPNGVPQSDGISSLLCGYKVPNISKSAQHTLINLESTAFNPAIANSPAQETIVIEIKCPPKPTSTDQGAATILSSSSEETTRRGTYASMITSTGRTFTIINPSTTKPSDCGSRSVPSVLSQQLLVTSRNICSSGSPSLLGQATSASNSQNEPEDLIRKSVCHSSFSTSTGLLPGCIPSSGNRTVISICPPSSDLTKTTASSTSSSQQSLNYHSLSSSSSPAAMAQLLSLQRSMAVSSKPAIQHVPSIPPRSVMYLGSMTVNSNHVQNVKQLINSTPAVPSSSTSVNVSIPTAISTSSVTALALQQQQQMERLQQLLTGVSSQPMFIRMEGLGPTVSASAPLLLTEKNGQQALKRPAPTSLSELSDHSKKLLLDLANGNVPTAAAGIHRRTPAAPQHVSNFMLQEQMNLFGQLHEQQQVQQLHLAEQHRQRAKFMHEEQQRVKAELDEQLKRQQDRERQRRKYLEKKAKLGPERESVQPSPADVKKPVEYNCVHSRLKELKADERHPHEQESRQPHGENESHHILKKFKHGEKLKSPNSHSVMSSDSASSQNSGVFDNGSLSSGSVKGGVTMPSQKINKERFELHPLLRPHLPEAELEEEIENCPIVDDEMRREDATQRLRKDSPHLIFEITSDDGFRIQADSFTMLFFGSFDVNDVICIVEAWRAVTDRVQDARLSAHMKPVSFVGIDGLRMCGLTHPTVIYLLEQLPGAKHINNYQFKYRDTQYLDREDGKENPYGCSRAEPFKSRNQTEMFSFLLSRYRQRPEYDPNAMTRDDFTTNMSQRRQTSLDLPMAMRFRHLKTFAKEAVGVYQSNIHGRGLFCKRDIDVGEMIIEYSGEVIRSVLTDKREKYYESKGIGCYMFRKDKDHVIDSTVKGNAARFINHSCEPNCYSKVIPVENRKHIVIFALRAIKRGEELTYDYKFPIEDVKIPCTCASRRCRKYLN